VVEEEEDVVWIDCSLLCFNYLKVEYELNGRTQS
jgi:hypothetical protein